MLASGVDFADVDLAEAGAEGFQHEVGLGHSAVDLFCVADVEAEGCVWEAPKDDGKLLGGAADGLALVGVLDTEGVSQLRP